MVDRQHGGALQLCGQRGDLLDILRDQFGRVSALHVLGQRPTFDTGNGVGQVDVIDMDIERVCDLRDLHTGHEQKAARFLKELLHFRIGTEPYFRCAVRSGARFGLLAEGGIHVGIEIGLGDIRWPFAFLRQHRFPAGRIVSENIVIG